MSCWPGTRKEILPWAVALVVALVVTAWAPSADAKRKRGKGKSNVKAEDLINPFLSPQFSSWLVGPISLMATEEEIGEYLALDDDPAAEAFVDRFWQARDPEPNFERNPLRETFDERAQAADRKFSEAGIRGRRTARGTVFILYGEPEEERFDLPDQRRQVATEVWLYPEDAKPGLDGKSPQRSFRFVKQGNLTVFYQGSAELRTRRERRRQQRFAPP